MPISPVSATGTEFMMIYAWIRFSFDQKMIMYWLNSQLPN